MALVNLKQPSERILDYLYSIMSINTIGASVSTVTHLIKHNLFVALGTVSIHSSPGPLVEKKENMRKTGE